MDEARHMAAHAAIQAASHPRAYKAWFADLANRLAILGRKGGTIGGYGWSNHKPPHFIYNARAREAFEKQKQAAAHAAYKARCKALTGLCKAGCTCLTGWA